MSDEIVQVNFRMPKSLKDKIEEVADKNGRSITSEIVLRLESSFKANDIYRLTLDSSEAINLSETDLIKIAEKVIELKKPT